MANSHDPLTNIRLLVIRRGPDMRVMLPLDDRFIMDTTPFEVATMAVKQFMQLQMENPGRAQLPLTHRQAALWLPGALGPLDPELMIGVQLVGHWSDLSVTQVAGDINLNHATPTVVLNLIDIAETK